MTDKELLELAAKAAGWTWWRSKHGYWNLTAPDGKQHTACHGWTKFDPHTGEAEPEPTPGDALLEVGFCPITDDGDALRLLARLRMSAIFPTAIGRDFIEVCGISQHKETLFNDLNGAVRRAIVRAAAEIGRSMK